MNITTTEMLIQSNLSLIQNQIIVNEEMIQEHNNRLCYYKMLETSLEEMLRTFDKPVIEVEMIEDVELEDK